MSKQMKEMMSCLKELLGRLHICGSRINSDYPQTMKSINRLIAACYDLRGEQPCEKCAEWERAYDELYEVAGKEYKGRVIEAMDRLDPRKPKSEPQTEECPTDETQTKPCEYPLVGYVLVSQENMQELWRRCAEWERAYSEVRLRVKCMTDNPKHEQVLFACSRAVMDLMDELDPRRKQAEEPKPADYNYIFASPESLNRFLDETNFDAYHERPREEYFPMLRKPEPADDEPTPEEIEKVKAFVEKVLDGSEPTTLLRDDGEWRM